MTQMDEACQSESPTPKKPRLSEEEHRELIERLKLRKKMCRKLPRLMLAEKGNAANLNLPKESRVPISPLEIQSLITYACLGDETRNFPFKVFQISKWTSLANVMVLAVENVGLADLECNSDCFPQINNIFKDRLEMISPSLEDRSLSVTLAYIPLTIGHLNAAAKACKTLDRAVNCGYIHSIKNLLKKNNIDKEDDEGEINRAVVLKKLQVYSAKYNLGRQACMNNKYQQRNMGDSQAVELVGNEADIFENPLETLNGAESSVLINNQTESEGISTTCSRLDLLLNPSQMVNERIPVPGMVEYQSFLMTSPKYEPVTESSPMFSIDCEWVLCRGGIKALVRIAVVNERLECVYHTLIKPILPVSDYQTKYSGVTGKMLNHVQTTLKDVQEELQKLFPPDAIIVGQAVGGDLIALELFHPYIIDTSVIYNLNGARRTKTKLSLLAEIFLRKKIQMSADGHSPIEDAATAMELVLLKMKMGKHFGDVMLDDCQAKLPTGDGLYQLQFAQLQEMTEKMGHTMTDEDKQVYDTNSCLHQKLFTLMESHNISSLLISSPKFTEHYQPTLIDLHYYQLMSKKTYQPNGPVRILEADQLKDATSQTISTAHQNKLTIVHTELEDVDGADRRRKKLRKLDKAVGKIFNQCVEVNGLMIIIFSGTKEPISQNGVCLFRINQEHVDLTGLTTKNQPCTVWIDKN